MQEALPWIIALAVLVVVAAGMAFWVTRPRALDSVALPTEWNVGPRTVFTVDERRAYRHLRDAFPQYIVLAKLPLIRFCQPADAQEMRYWFDLLGSIHVTFAVCTAQGRVLVTIDLDGERTTSRRTQQIKQNVLAACRIRYLRCTIVHLPSVSELQTLLPLSEGMPGSDAMPAMRALEPAADDQTAAAPSYAMHPGKSTDTRAERAPRPRAMPAPMPAPQIVHDVQIGGQPRQRKERKALWQDSGLFQDSFFGIDNLRDAGPHSEAGNLLNDAARARAAAGSRPTISADPSQGMLESELLKQKRPGPR